MRGFSGATVALQHGALIGVEGDDAYFQQFS
jgi:hypothetical protein